MKFSTSREELLKPIQLIIGAVERRQTMPILSNLLLRNVDGNLVITATDLELELSATLAVAVEGDDITVPGRKFLDICKSLSERNEIKFSSTGEKAEVRAGKSRFSLATLPANDFPLVDALEIEDSVLVAKEDLLRLMEQTSFAMAQQDVRYYLNGLLFETQASILRSVATDGHRLALSSVELASEGSERQVIVPRKAVGELMRILNAHNDSIDIALSGNHLLAKIGDIRFVTKLIDGKFPDYQRVVPQNHQHIAVVDREVAKASLMRASILSNEKYRGIRLSFSNNTLMIQAHNPEQEEAQDEIEIEYSGPEIEIGFNVSYLLDVLNILNTNDVHFYLQDSNNSLLIQAPTTDQAQFVVMPMRL